MTAIVRPALPLPETATLLVVDIQERLVPAMPADEQASVIKHVGNLVALFAERRGDGPNIVYSEQYPKGLGATVAPLLSELAGAHRLEKTAFSVAQDPAWADAPKYHDIVLVGMEAHVCVLLTGLDLLAANHRVFVPHDAVASRSPRNRDNGLDVLARHGAHIVNTETLIFNALGKAGGDAFKRFSARIR